MGELMPIFSSAEQNGCDQFGLVQNHFISQSTPGLLGSYQEEKENNFTQKLQQSTFLKTVSKGLDPMKTRMDVDLSFVLLPTAVHSSPREVVSWRCGTYITICAHMAVCTKGSKMCEIALFSLSCQCRREKSVALCPQIIGSNPRSNFQIYCSVATWDGHKPAHESKVHHKFWVAYGSQSNVCERATDTNIP